MPGGGSRSRFSMLLVMSSTGVSISVVFEPLPRKKKIVIKIIVFIIDRPSKVLIIFKHIYNFGYVLCPPQNCYGLEYCFCLLMCIKSYLCHLRVPPSIILNSHRAIVLWHMVLVNANDSVRLRTK